VAVGGADHYVHNGMTRSTYSKTFPGSVPSRYMPKMDGPVSSRPNPDVAAPKATPAANEAALSFSAD